MSCGRAPSDPSLPHLGEAWSPGSMIRALRDGLRVRGRQAVEIECCRVERLRYREGKRAAALYALGYREGPGSPLRRQWVHGSIFRGRRAKRLYRKLAASEGVSRWTGGGPFQPVAYLPELEMLAEVFPFDRRLTTLPRLVSDLPAELRAVVLETRAPGRCRIASVAVEPVRYRPHRGLALRYAVELESHSGERTALELHAKVYPDRLGGETCRRIQAIRWQAARGRLGFSTPAPVAYLPELRTLVIEPAAGRSLRQALLEDPDVAGPAASAASALAAFHRSRLSGLPPRWPGRRYDSARSAGAFIKRACPRLAPDVEVVLRALGEAPESSTLRPTHGDIKLDHLFLEGDTPHFIDLDTLAIADPVADAATLYARLGTLHETSSCAPARARKAAEVFLEEYFARVPAVWRRQFPLHYAHALLQLALFAVRHPHAGWPESAAAKIERAARVVAEAGSPNSRVALSTAAPARIDDSTEASPERWLMPAREGLG